MAASSSSADAKVEAVWDGDKIVYPWGYVYLKVSHYFRAVLSKIGLDFNAGERDVPPACADASAGREAACFGPVARMVKGPKPAVSVATMA